MSSKMKKIVSMLIVFVITFTYSGGTLQAIATTDGLSVITNGFSKSDEIEFKSYFGNRDNPGNEMICEVNHKASVFFEIAPSKIGEGFLKKGTITACGADGSDINFKFTKILNVDVEEVNIEKTEEENKVEELNNSNEEDSKEEEISDSNEEDNIEENLEDIDETSEEEPESEDIEEDKDVENDEEKIDSENIITNEVTEELTNEIHDTVTNTAVENTTVNEIDIKTENNTIEENTTEENTTDKEVTVDVKNVTTENEVISRAGEGREEEVITDENNDLIDENKVIEEKTEEESNETYEELTAKDFEIEITNDNEITIQNIIYNTIIEVEIEYKGREPINLADLYKEINLKLVGNYINTNLDKKQVESNQNVIVGWSYSKDFEINGEYTQFSPFHIGEHEGIIVENKINVKRETQDENFLPVKETTVEIDVPDYDGKQPETVSVQATKLMATKGQDVGDVSFGNENWSYDKDNKKIKITVNNEKDGTAINEFGEDEYIVVYKYASYTTEETVDMDNKFTVTMEQYSGKDNVKTTKQFENTQSIKTKINNLITYNIDSTGTKINKAKINANYNQGDTQYETEFTTTVNLNILTTDTIEELKINSSKDSYLDRDNVEFDAQQDIYTSKVRFNYSEIKNVLKNGASIEIQNMNGEVLSTLTGEIQKENCEISLNTQPKGVYVIIKNVSIDGTIAVEFTKVIGKSNYDKAGFNNFKFIKSYASAELKYASYEERYAMQEIATTKQFENSQTKADIILTNNNLTTTAKNDGVELKIALNNDKEDTDLYVNPSFLLVFPKYVKEVSLENIGLIYGAGMKIESNEIYKEDDLVKMRIDLSGTQTAFCESKLTNGSNIVLNLNIELDEYTPRKQDQIKMYYCNEGVTNYDAQTKWTISKAVPNGILKDTNGFDVAIVNYKAMAGMILSNAIINYDGQSSKIKSISQGEKTAEIKTASKSQIATMELVAMNNLDNNTTETVFIGRVPFKGNTSVTTGKELGTTTSVKMLSGLREEASNPNMVTIYYSTEEKPTRDLKDIKNNWKINVEDFSQIKTYMIVLKDEMAPGTVLKYSYDFEIPEKLEMNTAIYGSFGAFYNNKTEESVIYESAEADKVGLNTVKNEDNEEAIEETNENVDIPQEDENSPIQIYPYGKNYNLYYGQIVTLVTKVRNDTNEVWENKDVVVTIPTGTVYTEVDYVTHDYEEGVYQEYTDDESLKRKVLTIDYLQPGDTKELMFEVRVLDTKTEKANLSGSVSVNNKTKNYSFVAQSSPIDVYVEVGSSDAVYAEDAEVTYDLKIRKNTDDLIKNAKLQFRLPNYFEIDKIKTYNDEELEFVEENKNVKINNVDLTNDETRIYILGKIGKVNKADVKSNAIFDLYINDKEYSSNVVGYTIEKPDISVEQNISNTTLEYGENFDYIINIKNNSTKEEFVEVNSMLDLTFFRVNSIKLLIDGKEVNQELNEEERNRVSYVGNITPLGNVQIKVSGTTYALKEAKEIVNEVSASDTVHNKIKVKDLVINFLPIDTSEVSFNVDPTTEETRSISGNIWIDSDSNGKKSFEEIERAQIDVELLKDNEVVQNTTTKKDGSYEFTNVEDGQYTVVAKYDDSLYSATSYIPETSNDNYVYEIEPGKAITEKINFENENLENVDIGLVKKDKFDFQISQTIDKAIVEVNGVKDQYNYDDLDLARLEMDKNSLKDGTAKLVYKIRVQNVGNVEGKVLSIVDYVPTGMEFKEEDNPFWSMGTNGNIYYSGLKDTVIAVNDFQDVTLVLEKKAVDQTTKIYSNKAQIAYADSETKAIEARTNNFASQETVIAKRISGLEVVKGMAISFVAFIGVFGFLVKKEIIVVDWKNVIKKVYK